MFCKYSTPAETHRLRANEARSSVNLSSSSSSWLESGERECTSASCRRSARQGKWGLPSYSTIRDGPEHRPRFRPSVSVDGQSFDSPAACDTYRRAQDEAAKLAFLSLSPKPPTRKGKPSADGSSTAAKQHIERLSNDSDDDDGDNRGDSPETKPKVLGFFGRDLKNQCESQLQNYTQRRNLGLPVYSCTSNGPPHARRFQAMAVVDGCTFESPRYFNTFKEAEHAAAKFALMSLSVNVFQEDVLHCYKNLFPELAQREGLPMPVYTATRTSSPRCPMFVSSVNIGGASFLGEEGNSKKQAEMKAVRVAYSVLTERIGDFSSKAGDSEPEAATVTAGIDSSTRGMHSEKTAEGGSTSFSSKAQHDHSGNPFAESSFPDIAFPEAITVIPISDDKWVAASLEFPND